MFANIIQTALKCATAVGIVWMSWGFYLVDSGKRQEAENTRSAHEVDIAKYAAERTKEIISLYKGDKPVEKMGCPVDGLYQKARDKKGKIISKRIC